jgi:hypothetical protein
MNDVRTSFPSINSGSMDAYRGVTYYTGSGYNTATFPSSSSAISMNNFYSSADTFTGFTSITNQSIGTIGYPPNDQNGYAGYLNGRVSFTQSGGVTVTVDGWSADSHVSGYGGTYTLATASTILSGKTPIPGNYYNGAASYSYARDTSCIGCQVASGSALTIYIWWDKKGNPFSGSIVGTLSVQPYFS